MAVLLTGVVSAAETARKGEISSFNNYGENGKYTSIGKYEVAYGSAITDVTQKLPSTLTATMTTGEEVEVPVTWVCVSDNIPDDYVMPFATVSYTEGAQELNSQAPEIDTEMDQAMDAAAGMSVWTWIIWIIVIVIILVVAAIITPTSDMFTLLLVALPMWALYEVSILIVKTNNK